MGKSPRSLKAPAFAMRHDGVVRITIRAKKWDTFVPASLESNLFSKNIGFVTPNQDGLLGLIIPIYNPIKGPCWGVIGYNRPSWKHNRLFMEVLARQPLQHATSNSATASGGIHVYSKNSASNSAWPSPSANGRWIFRLCRFLETSTGARLPKGLYEKNNMSNAASSLCGCQHNQRIQSNVTRSHQRTPRFPADRVVMVAAWSQYVTVNHYGTIAICQAESDVVLGGSWYLFTNYNKAMSTVLSTVIIG